MKPPPLPPPDDAKAHAAAREIYLQRGGMVSMAEIGAVIGRSGQTVGLWKSDEDWSRALSSRKIEGATDQIAKARREVAYAFSDFDRTLAGLLRRVLRAMDGMDKDGKKLLDGAKPELSVGAGMWIARALVSDRIALVKTASESITEGWPRLDPAELRFVHLDYRPRGSVPTAPAPDPDDVNMAQEILERAGAGVLLPFKRGTDGER